MDGDYKILTNLDLENLVNEKQSFALDVLVGLSENPKRLSSRYFYDDRGSELFRQIMDLPEYYLTKCEFDVLKKNRASIASLVKGHAFNLVELGPGDGRKTSILIDYFLSKKLDFKYIPIDISEGAMKQLFRRLNEKFPELQHEGIVAEYFNGLKWLRKSASRKNLVLFLGSNLGNFNKPQSRVFLRNLWNVLNNGDFLITGFDLKKDIDQDKFRHYSSYDVFSGAMESYLVSLEKQTVYIEFLSHAFQFEAWEPIHTEYSYKYLVSDIVELAESTGFVIEKQLFDSKKYFVDSVWQVQKVTSLKELR
jgi:L-histidine N-alpha-methyltransferase